MPDSVAGFPLLVPPTPTRRSPQVFNRLGSAIGLFHGSSEPDGCVRFPRLLGFLCDTCLGVYSDTQKRLNQADHAPRADGTGRVLGQLSAPLTRERGSPWSPARDSIQAQGPLPTSAHAAQRNATPIGGLRKGVLGERMPAPSPNSRATAAPSEAAHVWARHRAKSTRKATAPVRKPQVRRSPSGASTNRPAAANGDPLSLRWRRGSAISSSSLFAKSRSAISACASCCGRRPEPPPRRLSRWPATSPGLSPSRRSGSRRDRRRSRRCGRRGGRA